MTRITIPIGIARNAHGTFPAAKQFAVCERCAYSKAAHTAFGPVTRCQHPKNTVRHNQLSIGAARAPGMPCGPLAQLAVPTAGKAIPALALETTESETAVGERREFARKLDAQSADPFTLHDMWGGMPS